MANFRLYTTLGCHLCEQAEALLQAQSTDGLEWTPVDIADSPALVETYGLRIPVVQCVENEQELGWPFAEQELAVWLRKQRE